jgi:hypothetical protein
VTRPCDCDPENAADDGNLPAARVDPYEHME